KDHTWVWSHLPGTAPPTPGRDHPRRYSLPRCLGHELIVSIDLLSMALNGGDVLLQSTHGIHNAVSESEMREMLACPSPDGACQALVARARASETTDDATAQVAVVRAVPEAASGRWWTRIVQPA